MSYSITTLPKTSNGWRNHWTQMIRWHVHITSRLCYFDIITLEVLISYLQALHQQTPVLPNPRSVSPRRHSPHTAYLSSKTATERKKQFVRAWAPVPWTGCITKKDASPNFPNSGYLPISLWWWHISMRILELEGRSCLEDKDLEDSLTLKMMAASVRSNRG